MRVDCLGRQRHQTHHFVGYFGVSQMAVIQFPCSAELEAYDPFDNDLIFKFKSERGVLHFRWTVFPAFFACVGQPK